MKNVLLIVVMVILSLGLQAQAPQGFSYQAVLRDASGSTITDANVTIRVSITDGENGSAVYQELHKTTTNKYGLIVLEIGRGGAVMNQFEDIDWGSGSKWLRIEADPRGGMDYQIDAQSELLSVPYAIYAANGGNAAITSDTSAKNELIDHVLFDAASGNFIIEEGGTQHTVKLQLQADDLSDNRLNDLSDVNANPNQGEILRWNGSEWVGDDGSFLHQQLAIINNLLTITDGNSISMQPYLDNTDQQQLSFNPNTHILTLSNGGQVDLTSLYNPQSPSYNTGLYFDSTSNELTVTDNGTFFTVDLDKLVDDADADPVNELQTITKTGNVVSLSNGGGTFIDEVDDADADATNELQSITKTGNVVSLSNGGGAFIDEVNDADADPLNETLTGVGFNAGNGHLQISDAGGTYSIDLSSLVDDADADASNELQTIGKTGNVVTLSNSGGSFVDEVDDADADPLNETITGVSFNASNGQLQLVDAGGTYTIDLSSLVDDADADASNELQTITKTGNQVTLSNSGGTFTDEVNDGDFDATNELQTISLSNDTLYLSNGGAVKLPLGGSSAANINGSTNYLMKFTPNGTSGGNSQLYDNGMYMGIGTTSPSAKFNIKANTGQHAFKVEQGTSTKMVITNYGRIGMVDNSAPQYLLDVKGNDNNLLMRSFNINANGTGISGNGNNVVGYIPTNGSGVSGSGFSIGVAGFATNDANSAFGGYFWNDNVYAYVGGWNFDGNLFTPYKIIGNGTVSTIVDGAKGGKVTMFAPEAPEVLFQDHGVGKLINGKVHISLDPHLVKNIEVSKDHPLKVYVQLEGDCNGVYVTNKTAQGFDVVELAGGTSNVSFSWMIVATRKNEMIEQPDGSFKKASFDVRFPKAPEMLPVKKLDSSDK